jgi:glycosyltransferase involved in cell wall biosynthesis
MATYNGERFLKEQLLSIRRQTYPNTELIISDDNSTDGTGEIVRNFFKMYERKAKFIKNPGERGLLSNFSNAIKQAEGGYIAFCDQDDVWYPDKIEKTLEQIDDYDIVHTNVDVIDGYGNRHPDAALHAIYNGDWRSKTKFGDFIPRSPILGCTGLMRADFVKGALPFPDGALFHDWWLALCAIKDGRGVKYISTKTLAYRQHGGNYARNTCDHHTIFTKQLEQNRLIWSHFSDRLSPPEMAALEEDRDFLISKYILLLERNLQYADARRFIDANRAHFTRGFFKKFAEVAAEEAKPEPAALPQGEPESPVPQSEPQPEPQQQTGPEVMMRYVKLPGVAKRVDNPATVADRFLRFLYFGLYARPGKTRAKD